MSEIEMDFIALDGDEEEITRSIAAHVPDPIVTITGSNIHLNTAAASAWGDARYVSISCTTEYIVLRPAAEKSVRTFTMTRDSDSRGLHVVIPAKLAEKKPAHGAFKLLRTRDGFAFNRYDQIFLTKK